MDEKTIIDNPPMMVKDWREVDMYRTLYTDIVNNGTKIKYVDRHALGVLAVAMCQYESFSEDIQQRGAAMTVEGDRALVTKRNPNLDAAQKLYPVILKLMGEFGMTPNSRSKKLNPLIGDNKPSGSSDDGWADV